MTDTAIITEEVVYWYEYGDCHTLALEIHRQTGWQLAALGATQDMACGGHVFVITPTGQALDIRGARPVDEVLHQYCDTAWCRHTVETIAREFGVGPYEAAAEGMAPAVAAHIVEQLEQAA